MEMENCTRADGDKRRIPRILDDEARRQIRFQAGALVGTAGLHRHDRDDIEQRLAIKVLRSLSEFDPRKASWRGFVQMVARREAQNVLRERRAKKRDHRRLLPCGERYFRDFVDAGAAALNQNADLAFDLAKCEYKLSDEHRQICRLLRVESISEAARLSGLPRSTFRDRLCELRQVFLDEGLEIYLPNARQSDSDRCS